MSTPHTIGIPAAGPDDHLCADHVEILDCHIDPATGSATWLLGCTLCRRRWVDHESTNPNRTVTEVPS